ncbi:MAG TPA: NAD-dependent epimerase/dehydratase family protein [Actinophytocola sp.]|uniref:NAD-dependent epimerase/dehydratase family protein n=1 Tax=Actinophytocola sp. TaxID=1872138 RepID=UPI002DBE1887|nr:NAD-dependent epimerase/dehydratase family protein [Actinophytocola sp.]HEU5475070.1 NAD-dependent epimerase/dehydratase family protein [Actinophytocola sp.]
MRVVVIGGTGHVGSYLVPRLVRGGHDVIVLSRGEREAYHPDAAWSKVRRMRVDRDAEDAAGTFGNTVAELGADAVVDLVCFTEDSARALATALRGRVGLLLHCGTIWVHGPLAQVPVTEDAPREPWGEYGTAKAAIEAYLIGEARRGGTPATVLHAGHIVGPGWAPCNPVGNFDLDVFGAIARGEEVALPNFGLETLHHVHADDVAQAFERALHRRSAAVGESFHATSPQALTTRGFAEAVAGWFGLEPRLRFEPFDSWAATVDPEAAETSREHLEHSPVMSIEKARTLLGYAPRYSSLQAVRESLAWQIAAGAVNTNGHSLAG